MLSLSFSLSLKVILNTYDSLTILTGVIFEVMICVLFCPYWVCMLAYV